MRARRLVLAAVVAAGTLVQAQQAPNLVTEVRAAMARQDFAEGERLIAAHRAAAGVTPIMMEALSWLGRGALAADQVERAEAYAQETYDLALAALKARGVDDEPRLATALGASIEVLSQTRLCFSTSSTNVVPRTFNTIWLAVPTSSAARRSKNSV